MYWRHTVDEEGKLQQLLWANGCSIFDYSIFGDVLAFDATYDRNKYKFPMVVFSGVNHHKQTTIFVVDVVSNKIEQTYVWLLESFLEAMNEKQPNNSGKNIKKKKFHKDFEKIMYANVEVEDFNMMCEELIIKHGLQDNVWLAQTYDNKSMWVMAYIRGKFYAGLNTTSQCEGLLTFINGEWGSKNANFHGVPQRDLTGYRSRLDNMEVNDFKWLPYEAYNNNLSRQVQQDKNL
ncbi:PREDICTED: protein FAR1-RELATED SEQUENCE 7-like [Lupinus angustifolius]|uniref:protein FAR1-RELATED SEQUENCE 7-like n=1 Tax=Lupinus angustifolius TaxID=3871 RepID=UPI00092E4980|nr:PREDICTED: protein FAR1-RELATED SEQUENCE 7-like [Lupinus angustifolius]